MEGRQEPSAAPASSARRWWVVGLVVVLILVMARVISSGSSALERGDAAHAVGDHLGAAASWREAISWVLPIGASWRSEAMDRLERLAQERESAGDLQGAVMALSSLRSGILAGHGLWRPDEDRLASVGGRLAVLLATWEQEDAQSSGRSVAQERDARIAFYEAQLKRDVRPSRVMSLLALVGFLAWLIGMYRAAGTEGRARARELVIAGCGLVAMLAGVALA